MQKGEFFVRFVHTSDNHLDMPLSSLPPEKKTRRRAQRRKSFSEIIDFTIRNNADFLLISGDLFHSPTPGKSILSFCRSEFERLGSIPVFISLGNHDYGIHDAHFPGNVHIFSHDFETVKYNNAIITGASFSGCSAFLAHLIPRCVNTQALNILCLHGDINENSDYNPINKEFLSSLGYDYIAMGHIHDYTKFQNIVYPGCHDGGGFDECGEKGFIFAEISKNFSRIEFIASSSLIYETIKLNISDYSSSLEIAAALEAKLTGGIYKISLIGYTKDGFVPNCETIANAVSHKAFHVTLEDLSEPDINLESSRIFKLFNEYLNNNFNPETALLARKLGISALKGEDFDL